jgi:hypothetical protein
MFATLPRRLLHLVHYVSGGGTWSLREHENQIIEAVVCALPPDKSMAVRRQLEQGFFVERSGGRINILRYYENDPSLAIDSVQFKDCLFNVTIEVDGEDQTAHVSFYKGWLFSVEFKKPRKYYAGKQFVIRLVAEGRPQESFTRSIDRLVHGAAGARGDREDGEEG